MELINCTPQYWEFVRTLRNDETSIGWVHKISSHY